MKARRPVLVVVLLAVALSWAWRTGEHLNDAEPVFMRDEPARVRESKVTAPAGRAPERRATSSHVVTASTLIESLRYEPVEPCAGDDVVVETVLRPSAEHAKVLVDGRHGTPQVVKARRAGPQRVRVLARGWGDSYERRDLMLEVRDCGDEPRLRAQLRAQAMADHDYMFALVPAPPGPVHWDFGDGASTTLTSRAEHRYGSRSDRPQSSYLVTARYLGPSGEEAARLTVSHAEATGIAARTPFPLLENEGERFVAWDAAQGLRTSRQVTNTLDVPLELALAELRGFPCDGSAAEVLSVPAAQLLDRTQLEARASAAVSLHVPAQAFARPICQLLVRLVGDARGRVATTTIALDTGVPHRTLPLDDAMRETLRQIVAQRGHHGPITADEIERHRFVSGT
jgi:hypothetical protein